MQWAWHDRSVCYRNGILERDAITRGHSTPPHRLELAASTGTDPTSKLFLIFSESLSIRMFVDVQERKLSDASFSVIKGHIIITFFLG